MNETSFIILEDSRKKALDNRDAVEYFKLCNSLGIEPEDFGLYEIGQADSGIGIGSLEKKTEDADLLITFKDKLIPGRDFYMPKHQYELKEWIGNYCKRNKKPIPKDFQKMKKKQLYAIYLDIREKNFKKA